MRITELAHTIHSAMPVFPGTEGPVLEGANAIEDDGFRETKTTMYSHTGTHMDAPAHMLDNGLFLDDLNAENFIGYAVDKEYFSLCVMPIKTSKADGSPVRAVAIVDL